MNGLDADNNIYYNDDAVVIEDEIDLEDTTDLEEAIKGLDSNG